MCGIAGMYTYKKTDMHQEYFSWCLSTMRRRGPDAQAIWHNGTNYITAFARLAIRDLSANGNQPMHSDCGNFVISFNGEIYNTDVLTNALKPYRQQYNSTTDTELLLYALKYLGIKRTLDVTDGMFAFALYDHQQNTLVLARDRVGIKPLYVGESSYGVVYSSQYDHIVNHPFFHKNALDEHAVATYLCLGYMPGDMGVVKETKMLPHGHYMTISAGKSAMVRYYRYGSLQQAADSNDSLETVIASSVSSQLVSDVPVGSFMSGGIDSTLVSYYANRQQQIDAFTIGVRGHAMDETAAAAMYADKFRLQHHCKYITAADMLQLVQENTAAYTEPFADYSSIPTLLLAAFAKEKVTVALSGDGPDELFWGYPRSVSLLPLLSFYTKGRCGKHISLLMAKLQNNKGIHLSRHWASGNFPDYYYSTLFITGALQHQRSILNYRPSAPLFFEDAVHVFEQHSHNADILMQTARQLEMDIHLQRILLKVDRASMYHSLEVRVPYLSNAMLDYSRNISWQDCIQNRQGKANLKRILSAKFGAEQVLKEKQGFRIPLKEWMLGELKSGITEKILDMPVHLAQLFHKPSLEKLIAAHMRKDADHSWLLWTVYALVQWDGYHRRKYEQC